MVSIGERLKLARKYLDITQIVAAKKAGVSVQSWRDYESNRSEPGISKVKFLSKAGISLNWLLDGNNGMLHVTSRTPDYCQIKLYNVQGSAGHGAYVEDEMVVDVLSFREKWIRNELNCDPKQLTMIFVTGDSMEPTLHSGDVVLIDHSAVGRVTDAIWVIGVEEGPLVKRVQVLPGAKARIISDNKTYETWDVDLKDLPEGMRFIGRVVWSGKRM